MNKRLCIRLITLFAALIFLLCLPVYASPEKSDSANIDSAIYKILDYEKSKGSSYKNSYIFSSDALNTLTEPSSIRNLISLSRLGYKENYIACGTVLSDIAVRKYSASDKLSAESASDLYDIALGIMACGINPQCIEAENGELDLIKKGVWGKSSSSPIEKGGTEKLLTSLILLDAYNTLLPENEEITYTRENIISKIFALQNDDGSFTSTSAISAPEVTAAAIYALSPYRYSEEKFEYVNSENQKVSETVGNVIFYSLSYLSENQSEDGGYSSFGQKNPQIISEVITALCSLGISPETDERFIKNGCTITEALLTLQNKDGSFGKSPSSEKSVDDITSYALKALVSLKRLENGKTFYYDFTDCDLKKEYPKSIYSPNLEKVCDFYIKNDALTSTDSYESLVYVIKSAERSLKTGDPVLLCRLNQKADELYSKKERIAELNRQSRYLSSFASVMGTKNLHALDKFLKEYDAVDEKDKGKIDNLEAVMSKKDHLSSKLFFTYTFSAVMYICIFITLIFTLFFLLRISPLWKYISNRFGLENKEYLYSYFSNDVEKEPDDEKEDYKMPYETNDEFFAYNPKKDAEELEYEPLEEMGDKESFFVDHTPFDPSELNFLPEDKAEAPLPYVENNEFFVYNSEEDKKTLEYFDDVEDKSLPYVGSEEFFAYNTKKDIEELIYDTDESENPPFLRFDDKANEENRQNIPDSELEYFEDIADAPLPYVENEEFFDFNEREDSKELKYFPDFFNDLAFLRENGDEVEEVRTHGEEIADLLDEEAKEDKFKIY